MASWELGFFSKHLTHGERLNELLFGLIMTLTFTLTAGFVVGEDRDAVRDLLVATIGCNVAWGLIDGILLVFGRAFDRGRAKRIEVALIQNRDNAHAVQIVGSELDEVLAPLVSDDSRRRLYTEIAERLRTTQPLRTGVRREDWAAAHAVFWLVVSASVPAALPFTFIDEPWLALRVSNAILLALFFVIGWMWAGYTTIKPWKAAVSMTLGGTALVVMAIALGG